MEGGAHAQITFLTASGFSSAGVEVRDANSQLTLTRCNLSNACPSVETLVGIGLKPQWPVAALWVHGGASCDAMESMLCGCSHGIGVEDPGTNLQARTFISTHILGYPIQI